MSNSRNLADLKPAAGGLLPSTSMAAGSAVSNIGYTPVNNAGGTMTGALTATGLTGPLTGNASTATNVAYSGLTGTVPTWNQSTTGNAATATTAATATNVAYSGLTGTVPTWNQSTTGNAATATSAAALTTGRTIALTGDVTYTSPSFNGSANVTAAATLATSGVTAGTYGSASAIPAITVDAKGRVTSVSTNAVSGGVSSLNGQTGAITNTTADAIGSYVVGGVLNTQFAKGATTAGSNLRIKGNGSTTAQPINNFSSSDADNTAIGCTGTWRCMTASGNANTITSTGYIGNLWVRIS